MGVNKTIELYDIEKPEELIDYYIEGERDEKLIKINDIKKDIEELLKKVEKALPELHDRLPSDYKDKKVKRIFKSTLKVVK